MIRGLAIRLGARRLAALRIAGIYLVLGILWILLSDRLAAGLAGSPDQFLWLETFKGWLFVLGTALILYVLATRAMARLERLQAQRNEAERERSETQQVLERLHGHLPGMAYRCRNDAAWTMSFVSDGCEELTGYRAAQLLHDAEISYGGLVHPDDGERVWSEVQAALAEGRSFQLTYRITTAAGEERWVWERGSAVLDASGEVEALEGYITDITSLKQLELQLFHAQKLEVIGRLVGSIAHDFNNVLTAISGYAELLLMELDAEDPGREDAREIQKAARRGAALTSQLLTFSGRRGPRARVVALNDVVDDMSGMLRRLLGENVELELRLAADVEAVKADPGLIQQIVMNLAVNGRDAMPDGGVLTIETANAQLDEDFPSTHPGGRSGPHVMLAVSDTGIGMDEETKRRIFEPFFTTKAAGVGTGLGLSTVYNIVKDIGGNIWVYSNPGSGTVFKVYFPQVDAAGQPVAPLAPRQPVRGGSETILLVEDEEALRILLAEALERAGYRVLAAGDMSGAQRLVEGHSGAPQLIVSDIVLPGGSAPEFVDRVKRLYPDVRALYISGYTDVGAVRSARLAPDMPFLQKPFSLDAFLGKIRYVLDTAA